MRAGRRSLVGAVGALALAAGFLGAAPPAMAAGPGPVVINEVYGGGGNTGAPYLHDFVELVNTSTQPVSLDGWSLQYSSATGVATNSYATTTLSLTLPAGASYLVREAAGNTNTAATPVIGDATGTIAMSGTAGKVALVSSTTALTCGADCDSAAGVVDFVGYGSTANDFEGTGPTAAPSNTSSVSRSSGHLDSGSNVADFTAGAPTPTGCGSACSTTPTDDAPSVTATSPTNGASGVVRSADLTVTFSEAVTVTDAFTLSCGAADQAFTLGGSGTTYTLDPTTDLPNDATCTLTVRAAGVSDTDGVDPSHPAADKVVTFSTGNTCDAAYTHAYEIQGENDTPAITGSVTTEGVVVGDYEGASPALRGFYVQDVTGDGNAATSDAVFVFEGSNANSVALGDVVRITGNATDQQGQTQVSMALGTTPQKCGTATVEPTDVTLPFASVGYPERYEGMLVRMPQTLTVSEHFQLGRSGEVLMSSGGRLPQPTSIAAPGGPALAQQAFNDRNQVLFDDGNSAQNADPIVFGRSGQPLSASNTLRGGDTATGSVGVLSYTWGGYAASPNAFRLRPINAMGGSVQFQPSNERPSGAALRADGTDVRVAGMNLLNFFNTFSGCASGTTGGPMDCRGAESQAEFDRQWPKTVEGITGTGADVIGINEIENDGYGSSSAIQFLVDRLNDKAGPGTYAFIDVDARTGQLDAAGSDAIKVGVLYKPAVVTPVGRTAALNSVAFVNGGDNAPRARPSVAQAFATVADGSTFVVDVNHFKSKGSPCNAADGGDGSGNCDEVRNNSAKALAAWLDSDPTGVDDPDVLLVGDYNSYAQERPVQTLEAAGYTNLIHKVIGDEAYSYVFDGQWGYLDYAFGTAAIQPQVTGVYEWHINSDEPSILDYNTNFKSAGQIASLYAPDEFRISDHDPVVVDLALTPPPETSTTTLSVSPQSQVYGTQSPSTWTATVALSRQGAPAGQVELLDGGTVIGSAPVSGGKATGELPAFLTAGTHQLAARFVPTDAALATGSTSAPPVSFPVTRARSTTAVAAQVGKVKSKAGPQEFIVDMTARVQLENSRTPAGTVTFIVDGVEVATGTVSGGSARAVATVSKGAHVVTATFTPADTDNYIGSDSPPETVLAK